MQWEKRCIALKNEAVSSSEGCRGGAVFGPSSDIHNQNNNGTIDSFDNVYSHSVKSHPSNGVLPLQCYTNEYQVSCSGISGVANAGLLDKNVTTSSLPLEASCSGANPFASKNFAGMHILSIGNVISYSLQLLFTWHMLNNNVNNYTHHFYPQTFSLLNSGPIFYVLLLCLS